MSLPELHPAIGPNRWCGPGALTILTGKPTDETAKLLREVSGKRRIMGISNRHMLRALHTVGAVPVPVAVPGLRVVGGPRAHLRGPALAQWARQAPTGRYLVEVTGHYVVLRVTVTQGGYVQEVADNLSVYPVPLDRFKRSGKRVRRAWRMGTN